MTSPIKGKKRIPVVRIEMIKERNIYYDFKKVLSTEYSYNILNEYIGNADREQFVVMCLDTKNNVTNITTAHIGSLNASVVHPREVFKTAILSNSNSVIVAHNHPSGDPTPSREDIKMTECLVEAGQILGIDVLDHIILGENRYISMKEKGYI